MPVARLIPVMAVPTIIAQLITIIYNLVDTYFVSSLGTNATAAVGVNGSLQSLITLAAQLIGMGACSYIARLLGAGKKKEADEVFTTSLLTGFFIGIVIILAGRPFLEPIVNLFGATPECLVYSMQYASYVIYAAPFMVGSLIMSMCLRSEGNAVFSMIGIGFGTLLNCFLDPLFIFYLGLGVAGASMATCISQVVSCAILIVPYLRRSTQVTLSLRSFRYTKTAVLEVLKIGSTSFFRQGLAVVASTLMNRVAGGYSTSVLAAISVTNRIMMFPFGVILGFGQGFQPVVGFNWGAKRLDRVRQAFTFSQAVSIVGSVLMCIVIFLFARPLIGLFTVSDEEMLSVGLLCIRSQCLLLPVHAWVTVINMFYAGIGRARNSILISTARQGYVFIPMLFILSALFGARGVACTQAAADVITLFIGIPMAVSALRLIGREQDAAAAAS